MNVCPICNRHYHSGERVCRADGHELLPVQRDGTTAAAPIIDWDGPMAGDVIGAYRLLSLIAEGGMGRIFEAQHLRLGRKVAIKFLLPEHAIRADLVQRFFNEARSVNAIEDPHIVQIFDFVEERKANGPVQVYMVMEYLCGEDARTRLQRERRLLPGAVIDIARQVARALQAAHAVGILHRDLKPDNVFLCRTTSGRDFIKLLDFGAAKAFGSRAEHNLTRPGVALGTPEYMAPEQILARPLDGRVDQYALGIVCFELLHGRPPFHADNVAEVLALQTDAPPPSLPEPARDDGTDWAALQRVIARFLAKAPEQRYPDLETAAQALEGCLRSPLPPPVVAEPPAGDGPTSEAETTVAVDDHAILEAQPMMAASAEPFDSQDGYEDDAPTVVDTGPPNLDLPRQRAASTAPDAPRGAAESPGVDQAILTTAQLPEPLVARAIRASDSAPSADHGSRKGRLAALIALLGALVAAGAAVALWWLTP